jgi:hypothetical protein
MVPKLSKGALIASLGRASSRPRIDEPAELIDLTNVVVGKGGNGGATVRPQFDQTITT